MQESQQDTRSRNRSNDCRNCRRRKVRCSQEHPACRQCLQSGLHCRPLLSRGGPSAWRVAAPTNAPIPRSGQSTALTSTPGTTALNAPIHNNSETTRSNPGTEVGRITTPSIPAELSLAPFRESIQDSWLYHHYMHRPVLQQTIVASSSRTFGAAAVSAATAISTTLFAKFHNQPLQPPCRSLQAPYCREYASAVEALSMQVPLFDVSRLEEVLVPALLLLISEHWLTGRSRQHYSGLEQTIRVSSEALFQQNRFQLFKEVRSAMVWYAISSGERTIFGEEWWKMAPFAMVPSPKTPSDYLIDYMADIAALLKDAKDIQSKPRRPQIPTSSIERELSNTSCSPGVGTGCYSSPDLVYETWLCDALLILILGFLNPSVLQERLTTPLRPHGALWNPDEALSAQYLAVEICRSLKYQLEHLSFPVAAHQWAMPIALAYVTLPPTDPVAEWVYAKILAAPESRRVPWLLYIERLQGKDRDAAMDLFALWPINRNAAQFD